MVNKKKDKSGTNVTKERLAGTPFETAAEFNAARNEILEETWRQLERARATRELLKKDDYQFFAEIFEKGLLCKYGENNGNLVRVFLSSDGIQIAIDEEMKTGESSEALVGVLIQSMSSSFMSNYLKAMGMMAQEFSPEVEAKAKSKNKKP